jgi:hypothetical protein
MMATRAVIKLKSTDASIKRLASGNLRPIKASEENLE